MQLGSFQYLGKKLLTRSLSGLELSLTSYPSNQRQPWHVHENPNIFLMLDGEFCDRSAALGDRYLAPLGMVFHPAGARHSGEAGPKGRAGLNIEPTEQWLSNYGIAPDQTARYRILQCPVSGLLALRLALSAAQEEAAFDQLSQDLILEILLPIMSMGEPSLKPETPAWFEKIEDIVNEADLRDCNLKRVAELLAVHPVYLARVFRQRYGCSLGEYVLCRRLVTSAVSVISEGTSLAEAALNGGFADQSYFSKLFRRETKRTPRALYDLRNSLRAG